ncbi:MAG: S8 family serine peptidase [Fimbriimonadales bacterium]|nr:S8 family serine peptidase [Fimbriimonadales bacterium]
MRIGTVLVGWLICAVVWAQPITLAPIAYDRERDAYYIANELVVGLEAHAPTALAQQAMLWVGQLRELHTPLQAGIVRVQAGLNPDSVREFLQSLPGVRYVERNYLAFACNAPNDPLFGQQWGLARIQALQAWASWQPQRTVFIAILDTGIDATHPDLSQKVRRHNNGSIYGYNAMLNNAHTHDGHGHGTHCAGIAAAHTHNGIGIAGVAAWNSNLASAHGAVQLMPVKVLNDQGFGSFADIARGITWAADNGAHIISLSLGGTTGTQQLHDAVNYAWNRGCLVVAAAGNNGVPSPFYPAFYENALAVAATDPNDRLTSFSQYGAWVDIAAPGEAILSTVPGGGYEAWSGTSMACPHVAGAAALIWSRVPSLSNQQLRHALEGNADPYQPYWFGGIGEGKGRLNMHRALQAALQMENTPAVSQLSLSANSVQAGGTVQGTVTLNRAAGAGGATVQLSSSDPNLAWCAPSITIPQGQTTGAFSVSTNASGVGSVVITASAGGVSRTATLQIVSPFRVQSVSLSPSTVTGGQASTLTVRLTTPAPNGGVQVQLSSSDPALASVPTTVSIPAGQTTASVRVNTAAVATRADVNLTASLNGSQAGAPLTINPPAPIALTLSPTVVPGGRMATATVTLNANAPAGGMWLRVSNDQPSRVWTPPTVYVRPGVRTVQFSVQTYAGRGAVNAIITVSTDGGSRSATLAVR